MIVRDDTQITCTVCRLYVQVIATRDGNFLDADFRGVKGWTSASSNTSNCRRGSILGD
jgi:hypothetical protein